MLTLAAGTATLLLAPEAGGAIAEWRHAGRPMFRPIDPAALAQARAEATGGGLACYPLVPYSNRIANRRFTWARVTYTLPARFRGFAIHGVGWRSAWAVTAQTAGTARIELLHAPSEDWPFAFRAWQDLTLSADALSIEIGIQNQHDQPAPCGLGLHPFFPRSPASRLRFTAASVWRTDPATEIPTHRTPPPPEWDHSAGLPVGPHFIDNCFAGWNGQATLDYPDLGYSLHLQADPIFGHTVVFVPPERDFFAVEPVTNMTDGINRMETEPDHGIFVLAPGERRAGRARFEVKEGVLF